MNYTFPLNKADLLLNSGFAILWQTLDLEDDSRLAKDNQKSLNLLISLLQSENQAAAAEFQKMASCFVKLDTRSVGTPSSLSFDSPALRPSSSMAAPADPKSKSTRKQLQAIASKWSSFSNKTKADEIPRRATVPQTAPVPLGSIQRTASTVSVSSTRSAPVSAVNAAQSTAPRGPDGSVINLDYLPLGDEFGDSSQTRTSSSTMLPPKKQQNLTESTWDDLLDNFDSNQALYTDLGAAGHALYQVPSNDQWTPEAWHLPAIDLSNKAPVPQSLLSFSEESLTSGDDFLFSAAGSNNGSTAAPGDSLEMVEPYRGITIPVDDEFDFHEIEA